MKIFNYISDDGYTWEDWFNVSGCWLLEWPKSGGGQPDFDFFSSSYTEDDIFSIDWTDE